MDRKHGSESKLAMITGASSGIGAATALKLAEKGYDLMLTARRADLLREVADKCRAAGAGQVSVKSLDVTDVKAVEEFFVAGSSIELQALSVLVNNAGLAKGVDPLDKGALSDWQLMLDTNVLGLLAVTRFALPLLKKNHGHIVNIGSVAGHWTYAGGAVYCATKAAVKVLTEGLRMDLHGQRVRVTNIEPGMVETDFSRVRLGSEEAAQKVYENFHALSADDIAECIEWSLSRPPHVNIQEMIVFPTDQGSISMTHRPGPSSGR
jgi:3-hydroxy acid dehydrogenase / malonic semialdehyde reductase